VRRHGALKGRLRLQVSHLVRKDYGAAAPCGRRAAGRAAAGHAAGNAAGRAPTLLREELVRALGTASAVERAAVLVARLPPVRASSALAQRRFAASGGGAPATVSRTARGGVGVRAPTEKWVVQPACVGAWNNAVSTQMI
jgi:hypothetical protein